MRFCVNVSILFKEVPFLERFARAAEAGFSAAEFWWPSGEDLDEVEGAVKGAGVEVALFNFDAGDMPGGDRGLLSDPKRVEQFRSNVPVALELARSLDCRRLNALVGHRMEDASRDEQLELARENVAWAAGEAAEQGAEVMIEAVNTFENGPYLLYTTEEAAAFVQSVGRPNVRLQYDFYHMQRMEGNLVANLRKHIGSIGHVQVADSPGRGEPGTGEINYPYVLAQLEELGSAEREDRREPRVDSEGPARRRRGRRGPRALGGEMAEKIGFVGLGIMGKPMARNLMESGYELIVHNRSQGPVDELVREGAEAAGSPSEIARESDVIVTMLPDSPDVQRVVAGEGGVLAGIKEGSLLIDMSTISPVVTEELAAGVKERGASMLDAPVSGGDVGAIEGTLSIMVGGGKGDFERAEPLFDVMGKTVTHVGTTGAGQVTKAANQIVVALTIEAVSEALVLGSKGGVEPEKILDVLSGGLAGNKVMEVKREKFLSHTFDPGFRSELHHKDLGIALAAAREYGVALPVTAIVDQMLLAMGKKGWGGEDHSALLRVIEDLSQHEIG
jgi:2-hydroxy-3-oxopropionate reductase